MSHCLARRCWPSRTHLGPSAPTWLLSTRMVSRSTLPNLTGFSVRGSPSSCAGVRVNCSAQGTLSASEKPMLARLTYSLTSLGPWSAGAVMLMDCSRTCSWQGAAHHAGRGRGASAGCEQTILDCECSCCCTRCVFMLVWYGQAHAGRAAGLLLLQVSAAKVCPPSVGRGC